MGTPDGFSEACSNGDGRASVARSDASVVSRVRKNAGVDYCRGPVLEVQGRVPAYLHRRTAVTRAKLDQRDNWHADRDAGADSVERRSAVRDLPRNTAYC